MHIFRQFNKWLVIWFSLWDLQFQTARASYHFRAPELLTISERLSFWPFQSTWASYHFRATELLAISEHPTSSMLYQDTVAHKHLMHCLYLSLTIVFLPLSNPSTLVCLYRPSQSHIHQINRKYALIIVILW
jgi:hypothetical protein